MKKYSGIDLHSNNDIVGRCGNKAALSPYAIHGQHDSLAGCPNPGSR